MVHYQASKKHCAICQTLLTLRKGTMPSRDIACKRRGAPVKLCRPAPQVEKRDPITMTQGEGQANVPTTKFPLTPSPNLREKTT